MEPLLGVMCPDACEIVRLEFETHRHAIRLRLAAGSAGLVDTMGVGEQALQVMTNLLSDHISSRKLTWCPQLSFERVIERQVNVNLAVTRAVEGADRGVSTPARGINFVVEQNQRRFRIPLAHFLKLLAPNKLSVLEHNFGKLGLLLLTGSVGDLLRAAHEIARIDAKDQPKDQDDDAGAAADGHARMNSPAILDVAALFASFPFHMAPRSLG